MSMSEVKNTQDQDFRFPESVHVVVTDTHIQKGERGECAHCPIALAISEGRTFPHALFSAAVCKGHVEILSAGDGAFKQTYYLPESARKFIIAFDADRPVQPFDFHLQRAGLTDAEQAAL